MSDKKETFMFVHATAIDPGTENVNQFDGLLHKVQQGDVNASKSVYKACEDSTPCGFENTLEFKNYEALVEIVKCPSEREMFIRIKQVIIEKDVRIFDKMSRRRKKIYISRLSFYEIQTGKYTTRKYKNFPGFKIRPVRLRYTEIHGFQMEKLLNDWAAIT